MQSEINRRNDVALLHGSRLRRDGRTRRRRRHVVVPRHRGGAADSEPADLPRLSYRLTVTASHLLHRGGAGARQRGVAPAVGEPTHSWIGDRHLRQGAHRGASRPALGVKGGVLGLGAGADGDTICCSRRILLRVRGRVGAQRRATERVGLAAAAGAFAGGLLVSSTLFDFDAAPGTLAAPTRRSRSPSTSRRRSSAPTISTLRGGWRACSASRRRRRRRLRRRGDVAHDVALDVRRRADCARRRGARRVGWHATVVDAIAAAGCRSRASASRCCWSRCTSPSRGSRTPPPPSRCSFSTTSRSCRVGRRDGVGSGGGGAVCPHAALAWRAASGGRRRGEESGEGWSGGSYFRSPWSALVHGKEAIKCCKARNWDNPRPNCNWCTTCASMLPIVEELFAERCQLQGSRIPLRKPPRISFRTGARRRRRIETRELTQAERDTWRPLPTASRPCMRPAAHLITHAALMANLTTLGISARAARARRRHRRLRYQLQSVAHP